MKKKIMGGTALAASAALLAAGTVFAAPASAAPLEIERESSGMCSSGARWDFNLERDFGVVDIDFEIDGATAGQRWTVRMEKNGKKILKRSVLADNEGELDVSHLVRDSAGTDKFSVRATSASGQVCSASLRI
jgi:hypothetical protein